MVRWSCLWTAHVALLLAPAGWSTAGAHEYCCPPHENHSDEELWTAVRATQPWMLLHHYWNGADIEVKDEEGLTPFAYSARIGEYGLVRMFMDLNVSIDPLNNDGVTPLMDVVQRGYLDMARMLLEEGANPDAKDSLGLTPIWYACKSNLFQMVKLLLDFNADTEARDDRNIGPLALAAFANRLDITTLLLDRGANPTALKELTADPSLRRRLFWWDVSTLESLLYDRGFSGVSRLLRESLDRWNLERASNETSNEVGGANGTGDEL